MTQEPTKTLFQKLIQNKQLGKKSFAVLIDPDKVNMHRLSDMVAQCHAHEVAYFFVGGSLIASDGLHSLVTRLKELSDIPVVLFPGSNLHLVFEADAILFLSLISGRNPEFLIGQHVAAAPLLKKSKLEIWPTGYMLVDSGVQTTVSYISNTTPIPYDKNSVAACTAMAGEMLGLKLMYLDAGSGAQKPVSARMIAAVTKATDTPLIVGGGITNAQAARSALEAGADVIVVGNGIEKDPSLLVEVAKAVQELNAKTEYLP
ncbi:putative glycerol-1-phosphate prenyltransferase [Flexibacter flexilis DSM 6793]|uniref:Geranylgeranylglyceryl phosphate synthase n=1 Tax=Flexibacter flexilis DSM 6793 TaxID=927664 RepID=A0A1I1K294_9BACT|nr:geranylgeranylglyceryl/heptaprenylglyceryl phosphate synthase [Flexibacter flexilis]SFC55059.1 putative glycerol-1-phosphate prenyltransferase [Flexibacter flexilis DSM 6793]